MINEEKEEKRGETDLGEVVLGFADVEKEIAEMGDLVGGIGIAIEIAESEDGQGEEDEAKHLLHSLPHTPVSQSNISGVRHLAVGQAIAECLLPKGGHRVVHRMEIFFVVIETDCLFLMQVHCHVAVVVVCESASETGDEHRDTDDFDRLGEQN